MGGIYDNGGSEAQDIERCKAITDSDYTCSIIGDMEYRRSSLKLTSIMGSIVLIHGDANLTSNTITNFVIKFFKDVFDMTY